MIEFAIPEFRFADYKSVGTKVTIVVGSMYTDLFRDDVHIASTVPTNKKMATTFHQPPTYYLL